MPNPSQPPNNVEAEEALLGAVMLYPAALDTLDVSADDFYIVRNRLIWKALKELRSEEANIDFITLCDRLEAWGVLGEAGGAAYITRLLANVPSALHAESYAAIIREKALRRRMLQIANQLARAAYAEEDSPEQVLMEAVDQLSLGMVAGGSLRPLSAIMQEVLEYISARTNHPGEIWGIPTGLVDLDRLTGGVEGTWYIAGGPGTGKSLLMLQIALHAAGQGYKVAIFSLEMSALSQGLRAVSAAAQVPTRLLKMGKLEADDWQSIYAASERLARLPIYICDQPGLTTEQIGAHLARLSARGGVDLFVIDYLYLMDGDGKNDIERTEAISRRLKALQRKYARAGITVNSVVKTGMDAYSSRNADMRGSGQLIHDADVVLFIRKHDRLENVRILELTKGRDLDTSGVIELVKLPSWPAFKDATHEVLAVSQPAWQKRKDIVG